MSIGIEYKLFNMTECLEITLAFWVIMLPGMLVFKFFREFLKYLEPEDYPAAASMLISLICWSISFIFNILLIAGGWLNSLSITYRILLFVVEIFAVFQLTLILGKVLTQNKET